MQHLEQLESQNLPNSDDSLTCNYGIMFPRERTCIISQMWAFYALKRNLILTLTDADDGMRL